MKCPVCGEENDDNWLVYLDFDGPRKQLEYGGCQACWERQCDDEWWEMVQGKDAEAARGKEAKDVDA